MQTNGSSLDSLSLAGIETALKSFHGEFSYVQQHVHWQIGDCA